jgi:hypothetical protein
MRLANSCIQVLLCKDAAQPLKWADLADAMLLRIILMVQYGRPEAEPQNTPLKFWEEMHHSIKESACIVLVSFRRVTSSRQVTKLTRLMDKQTQGKISQAYEVVLQR